MTPGSVLQRSSRHRRRLRGIGAIAATTALVASGLTLLPQTARADDVYAPGVGTRTVFDNSTPLTTSTGEQAPGIKGAKTGGQGATEIKFGNRGDLLLSEKNGRLIWFENTRAKSGTVLTDASGKDLVGDVMTIQDTGLGGIALDPGWPRRPYIYALYLSNDKLPEQGGGKWGPGECKNDGTCITQGKLERITVADRLVNGKRTKYIAQRTPLITDWCQGTRTHSVGDLTFGPDGYLYASAGDGTPEFGGQPIQQQICAKHGVTDKYLSRMATLDVLDPNVKASLNGKIIKVDPRTGKGAPGNPWARSADPNRRRIVAYGFRNPYRMAFRPGTQQLAVSMVGYDSKETVWSLSMSRHSRQARNAGWPCWEGSKKYLDGPLCAGLSPDNGTVAKPLIEWDHAGKATSDETCQASSPQASMGVAWASWWMPYRYWGGLFFNDYGRGCTYFRDRNGRLSQVAQFPKHTMRQLVVAPDGQLYFPDYQQGAVRAFTLR